MKYTTGIADANAFALLVDGAEKIAHLLPKLITSVVVNETHTQIWLELNDLYMRADKLVAVEEDANGPRIVTYMGRNREVYSHEKIDAGPLILHLMELSQQPNKTHVVIQLQNMWFHACVNLFYAPGYLMALAKRNPRTVHTIVLDSGPTFL